VAPTASHYLSAVARFREVCSGPSPRADCNDFDTAIQEYRVALREAIWAVATLQDIPEARKKLQEARVKVDKHMPGGQHGTD